MGATAPTHLQDGSELAVVVEEYSGGITGTKYNNVGIPADVQASDPQAVDVASRLLRDRIAKGP